MGEILKRLWGDPAYFTGVCRFLAVEVVGLVLSGKVSVPQPYEGWIWAIAPHIAALSVLIPAGQTNKSAGEIKAIAQDPAVAPKPTS